MKISLIFNLQNFKLESIILLNSSPYLLHLMYLIIDFINFYYIHNLQHNKLFSVIQFHLLDELKCLDEIEN
jgi:hypothetical protein